MIDYPQVTINAKVKTKNKYKVLEHKKIKEAFTLLEEQMSGEGRIIVRPSGTEPVVRVMIEGKDKDDIFKKAQKMVQLIEETLG
jgi:phosphoglucosamine mutase